MKLIIFSDICCPSVCLLGKSVQVLCLVLNWTVWVFLLSFMCSFYSLDINPLSKVLFAKSSPIWLVSHLCNCLLQSVSSFHGIASTFKAPNRVCTALYSMHNTFCHTAAERLGWQHARLGREAPRRLAWRRGALLLGVCLQAGTQTSEQPEHDCGRSGL